MKHILAILMISSLMPVVTAVAQPNCPNAENIHITPESPSSADSVLLVLGLPGATAAEWELVGQDQERIDFELTIHWSGGFGAPPFGTRLGPLQPGDYELAISPRFLDVPDACPEITIPLTVSGTPATPVAAPLFSLPGLLVLIGVLGGFAWRRLRWA